jgi:hypothetical protein
MAKKKKSKKKKITRDFTPHTIRIEVDGDAVTYTHSPGDDDGRQVYVEAGDTVKWKGPKNAFAVLFGPNGSPFNELVFGGPKGGSSHVSTVLGVTGTFKYAVLAIDGSNLVTDDPDIIVT